MKETTEKSSEPKYGTHRYKRLTKRDRAALESSVARYLAYAKTPRVDLYTLSFGVSDCALCEIYFTGASVGSECRRCPIAYNAGERLCRGTPYSPNEYPPALSVLSVRARTKAPGALVALRRRCREQAAFMQRLLDNDPGPYRPKP